MGAAELALSTLIRLGDQQEVGVSELADALGVARSTAHRTLNVLCKFGFAARDPGTRMYRLGAMISTLGAAQGPQRELVPTARPHLEWLAQQTHETVDLIVRRGADAVFLDSVESTKTVRVTSRTGDHLPAHSCAGGKALLATLTPAQVHALFHGDHLPTVTDRTISDPARLERELTEIRQCGYALNRGEGSVDVHAVGVAVRGAAGEPIAAVTIATPSGRLDVEAVEKYFRLLRTAAERITADLLTRSRP